MQWGSRIAGLWFHHVLTLLWPCSELALSLLWACWCLRAFPLGHAMMRYIIHDIIQIMWSPCGHWRSHGSDPMSRAASWWPPPPGQCSSPPLHCALIVSVCVFTVCPSLFPFLCPVYRWSPLHRWDSETLYDNVIFYQTHCMRSASWLTCPSLSTLHL